MRRGWRGRAGARSTWPPLLTARCRGGPSQSVSASVRWGSLLPGAAPSTVTLLTAGHESGNLSGDSRQFFCLHGKATTSSLDAADGRATALARAHAARMALRLSRCHHAAAWTLLGLQPAHTHAGCDQPNPKQAQTAKCIFGASLRPWEPPPPRPQFSSKTPARRVAPGATKPAALAPLGRPDGT